MSDSFDDFIRKQSRSSTGEPTSLTPDQEKAIWLAQLGKLYALIRESLQKYIDDGTSSLTCARSILDTEIWQGI